MKKTFFLIGFVIFGLSLLPAQEIDDIVRNEVNRLDLASLLPYR
jgi:hypothetical protein